MKSICTFKRIAYDQRKKRICIVSAYQATMILEEGPCVDPDPRVAMCSSHYTNPSDPLGEAQRIFDDKLKAGWIELEESLSYRTFQKLTAFWTIHISSNHCDIAFGKYNGNP